MGAPAAMDFSDDHFLLFGLPRRYALDEAALTRRYHEVQASVHPDKYADQGDSQRRLAMQWTTRINEAYQTLRQPLRRARYLLSLVDIDADQGREMDGEFLLQQMDWRERVAEARGAWDVALLEDLLDQAKKNMAQQYRQLAAEFENYPQLGGGRAVVLLRQLMFQEKLLHDIDDALAAAEA